MKKLLLITAITTSFFAFSQSKTAHINYNELLQSMPEMVIAKSSLEEFTKTYQNQLDKM